MNLKLSTIKKYLMRILKKYFSRKDLIEIAKACTRVELSTTAEIRVSIMEKRRLLEKNLTVAELALREFHRLGMEKTRQRNGILLFILLKEKSFIILPDQGLSSQVPPEKWEQIARWLSNEFKNGNYRMGVIGAIMKIGEITRELYPSSSEDIDELPDEVSIR